MKRIPALILLLLLTAPWLLAQEKTYGGKEDGMVTMRSGLGSLVIIPFEDRMYLSDADAPIGRETGLNPGELQIKFRNALLESLESELSGDWDLTVLYDQTVREENFDLDFVHASRKYNFEVVSDEVLMDNDTTLSKKDLKGRKPKKGKSGIHEGQVVTHSDDRERYMNLEVSNDTLMQFLGNRTPSDYYLFINELDIRHYIDDPDRIASGGLSYRLKVHFTCLDEKGDVLVSGAATSKVKSANSNIYGVIKEGMPELTGKMAKMIRKKAAARAQR